MNRPLLFLILACFLRSSNACNGYSIKLIKHQNCVDDPIIKLQEKNFNVVLDSDCNLYVEGCVEVTKSFKTAKAKYLMKKPPLPELEGEVDLCSLSGTLKSKAPDAVQALEIMGIPTKCPVEAKSICGGLDKKFNLLKYKNQIGMAAGTSEVRVEIEHDTGKSCLEIQSTISKPRKG